MDEEENSGNGWFSSFLSDLGGLAETGAKAYATVKASKNASSEDEAFLRGQLSAVNYYQQAEQSANTLKIGDAEISTSSLVWIIGGTLGMIFIGLGLKKLVK